jgi:hypothetical protein
MRDSLKATPIEGKIKEARLRWLLVRLKYYNKVRTYRSKFSATKLKISNPNLI